MPPTDSSSRPLLTASLTYLTNDLPGLGGVIKRQSEDFLVEEQPLYPPTGSGEHVMLFIEKRNLCTTDVVRRLAKAFHARKSDVGYAGLKDKYAVTRQHFTVWAPKSGEDEVILHKLTHAHFKVLWAQRHVNKLRRGHHAGNRFVIRIREVQPTDVVRAKLILDQLSQRGVPNYLGEQRFGYRQNNHLLGRYLLRQQWREFLDLALGQPQSWESPQIQQGRAAYDQGDYGLALSHWPRYLRPDRQALDALRQGKSPLQAILAMDELHRQFMITSLQSAMFNHVLDQRVRMGNFDQLQAGDLAWKHDNGSVFAVDQATATLENSEAGRVRRFEVSPSGPMWGPQMIRPADQVLAWEEAAFPAFDISQADFTSSDYFQVHGMRRPLRMKIKDAEVSGGVDEHGAYIRVSFELAKGCFATTVLRELMKPQVAHHDDSQEVEDAP